MTDYNLKDYLLNIAFGDVITPAEGAHLKVFKRDGSGDVLANAISDVNGDFPLPNWPDYSGDVIACYYYESAGQFGEISFVGVGNELLTQDNGTITVTSGSQNNMLIASELDITKKYIVQFDGMASANKVGWLSTTTSDTNPSNSDDYCYWLSSASFSRFNGMTGGATANSSNISPTISGSVVLDFPNNTAMYLDSSGVELSSNNLVASVLDTYFYFQFSNVGAVLFTNIDTLPFPYPAGDYHSVAEAYQADGTKHPPRAIVASPVEYVSPLSSIYILYNKQFDAGDTSVTAIDGEITNSVNWAGLEYFSAVGKPFASNGWLNTGTGTLGSFLPEGTVSILEDEIRDKMSSACSGFVRISSTEDIQSPSFERTVISVGGTSGDLLCGLIVTTDYVKFFNDASGVRQEVTANYTFTNGNNYDVYYSRDALGNVLLYVDGVSVGGGVITLPNSDTENTLLYVGNNANLSEAGIGGVYEAAWVHNAVLSASEFNAIRGDLS